MQHSFNSIKLQKHVGYGDQIREMVRELLTSGEFLDGEKLPSLRKLAATLGTHPVTVHTALKALEKEGLLSISPRKGMFVQKREEKLTCVGVYCRGDILGAPYAHVVQAMLKEELHKIGVEMVLWMDSRPLDQQHEPWQLLIKAAEQRRFQAFVAIETNFPLLKWQQKLPVPTAFLANGVSTGVSGAIKQFVELSLQELARQGCRSVGLIAPIDPTGSSNPDGTPSSWMGMLEHFIAVAGDLNLQVKNGWMRTYAPNDPRQGEPQNRFGYREFLNLWNEPEKPEGLVVFSDSVALGTVMAIREKQVRVPEELKLVLYKNETIELFCPMPVTFVVDSERNAARALIEQIQRQFRGESCESISLPYKIEAHNNP